MEFGEVVEVLGLQGEIKTKEELKAAVESRFVLKDEAEAMLRPTILNKFVAETSKHFQKAFSVTEDELKSFNNVKGMVQFIAEKKAQELEEVAKTGSDEKYTKIKSEYDKLLGDLDRFKNDNQKLLQEKEQIAANAQNEIKSFKVNNFLTSEKSKLSFKEGITEIEKTGFETILNNKYQFDLNDKGELDVKTKDGNPVPHPTKTGVYLTPSEVLDAEISANNLKKLNNLGGSTPQPPAPQPLANHANEGKTLRIHPAAEKAAAAAKEAGKR